MFNKKSVLFVSFLISSILQVAMATDVNPHGFNLGSQMPLAKSSSLNIEECSTIVEGESDGFIARFYSYVWPNDTLAYTDKYFLDKEYYSVGRYLDTVKGVTDINFFHFYGTISGVITNGELHGYPITISNFSVEYTGWFVPKETGTYKFQIGQTDDATLLQLYDSSNFLCCEGSSGYNFTLYSIQYYDNLAIHTGKMDMIAGEAYPMKIVYFNRDAVAIQTISFTDPKGVVHKTFNGYAKYYDGLVCPHENDEDVNLSSELSTATTTSSNDIMVSESTSSSTTTVSQLTYISSTTVSDDPTVSQSITSSGTIVSESTSSFDTVVSKSTSASITSEFQSTSMSSVIASQSTSTIVNIFSTTSANEINNITVTQSNSMLSEVSKPQGTTASPLTAVSTIAVCSSQFPSSYIEADTTYLKSSANEATEPLVTVTTPGSASLTTMVSTIITTDVIASWNNETTTGPEYSIITNTMSSMVTIGNNALGSSHTSNMVTGSNINTKKGEPGVSSKSSLTTKAGIKNTGTVEEALNHRSTLTKIGYGNPTETTKVPAPNLSLTADSHEETSHTVQVNVNLGNSMTMKNNLLMPVFFFVLNFIIT